jgi:hypothetical protein
VNTVAYEEPILEIVGSAAALVKGNDIQADDDDPPVSKKTDGWIAGLDE